MRGNAIRINNLTKIYNPAAVGIFVVDPNVHDLYRFSTGKRGNEASPTPASRTTTS